jgi:hypothetical protein
MTLVAGLATIGRTTQTEMSWSFDQLFKQGTLKGEVSLYC